MPFWVRRRSRLCTLYGSEDCHSLSFFLFELGKSIERVPGLCFKWTGDGTVFSMLVRGMGVLGPLRVISVWDLCEVRIPGSCFVDVNLFSKDSMEWDGMSMSTRQLETRGSGDRGWRPLPMTSVRRSLDKCICILDQRQD